MSRERLCVFGSSTRLVRVNCSPPRLLRLRRGYCLDDRVVGCLTVIHEPGTPDVVDRRIRIGHESPCEEPPHAIEPEVRVAVDHIERGLQASIGEDHGPSCISVASPCIANDAVKLALFGTVFGASADGEHLHCFDGVAGMLLTEPQVHAVAVVHLVQDLLVRVAEHASTDVR